MNHLLLVPEKRVAGNLTRYQQTYSFEYIPEVDELPPKLSLNVRTDTFNSLRFMHTADLWEFVSDAFFSFLVLKEMQVKPQMKDEFRAMNLDDSLAKLRKRIVEEYKRGIKVQYQTKIIIQHR